MKKIIILIALIIFIQTFAHATAQMGEILMYKGQTYRIYSTPLDAYFSEDRPKPKVMSFSCTACWRGYLGTWKIDNGFLFLVGLQDGSCIKNKAIPLSLLFPDQPPPIKAVWYSGILRIPQGRLLRYVHMGFASMYEKEILISVKQGVIIEEKEIDNTNHPGLRNKYRALDELKKMTKYGGINPENEPDPEFVKRLERTKRRLDDMEQSR